MNAFVQDARLGRLSTVLGPEALVLMRFDGGALCSHHGLCQNDWGGLALDRALGFPIAKVDW